MLNCQASTTYNSPPPQTRHGQNRVKVVKEGLGDKRRVKVVKDALCVSMCCGMSDHRYSKHQTDKQSNGQTDRQTQLSSVTYSNNNKACYLGVMSKGLVGGWVRGGGRP